MNFSFDIHEIQSGSGQDYAVGGLLSEGVFGGVFDGHGTSKVINFIRGLNMAEIAQNISPIRNIYEAVKGSGDTTRSGSTATFVKITKEFVQVWHAGDSVVQVFIDGVNAYTSTSHTFNDPKEVARTRHLMASIDPVKAPFPITPTCIGYEVSPIGHYLTGESLVPSMSLGHNDMTEMAPYLHEIPIKPTSTVRVVCVSDGVSDMLVDLSKGTAADITTEALRRWRQPWDLTDGRYTWKNQSFPTYDDVSCAICEYKP